MRARARGFSLVPLAAYLAALVALALLPLGVKDEYKLHIGILLFLWIALGQSWNVIGGYAGQYSVGHAAYFGVGAYTTLILLKFHQIAPWWGLWAAVASALLVSLVIGSITFRLRGPYFVLASIAVAEIIRLTALNWKDLTNGAEGILVGGLPPLAIAGKTLTDWSGKLPYYYLGLGLAAVTVCVNWLVQHSKLGYYLQAIREDQDAAHSLGIHLAYYKNVALGISAVFTAWAGALYGIYTGFIDPGTVLGLDTSVQIVLICIIGGIGTIFGPVIGALVVVVLSEWLRTNVITDVLVGTGLVSPTSKLGLFLRENLAHAHALIYGILVVVVILFAPEGVYGRGRRVAARVRRRATAPAREAPAAKTGG